MKTKTLRYGCAVIFLCSLFPFFGTAQDQSPAPMERFALVAGSNAGGPGRVQLKYADSDARSIAAVLTELGGVSDSDLILLSNPGLPAFREALLQMRQRVSAAESRGKDCQLVFYYSGHSDETGLFLGADKLNYSTLRSDIEQVPGSVRVIILDSCASGALTRAKGGATRPAFLFDASTDMKGHAYLTSSSAEESAQESDSLRGSYFTHYLVSGLRGAADLKGEGIVTLNDVYAFAFKKTLASTEKTEYGPQHPAYDISLSGSGDFVLTDLRTSAVGLSLAEELSGSMYIRDSRGSLVVELNKIQGKKMEIGLEPGRYDLVLTSGDARYRCNVTITKSQPVTITAADFQKAPLEATTARGEEAEAENVAGDRRSVAFSVNFLPDFTTGLFSSRVDRNVAINILAENSENLDGFEVAGLLNAESGNVTGFQAAGLANLAMQDVMGFQAAGLVNWGDKVSFAQCAGLANVATGGLKGGQMAGLANVTLGDSTGMQVGGVVNIASGTFTGAQIAGVANYSAGGPGMQVSGVVNIATGSTDGQVGILNVADTVHGLQVGLVNVAREMDGLPIGLVSLESGGIRNIEAWWDTSLMTNLGIKIGTRHTYTLIEGGYVPESNPVQWSYGLGWGGRIAIGRISIDADLSQRSTVTGRFYSGNDSSSVNPQIELRMLAGIPIAGFSIVAGAALDARVPWLSWEPDGTRASDFEILVPRLLIGLRI